jgi:Rne/Rng family ribonuclease
MKMIMPSHAVNVKPYRESLPLFARYQVESYLSSMFNPTVQLKSGGYIVIGVTEALVAVDVNSGRATKEGSIEETALKTNLEAAEEVARQLRLRDLAGLIVIDFIDMDERKNNAAVEKRMKDRLKTDLHDHPNVGDIRGRGLMFGVEIVSDRDSRAPDPDRAERIYYACLDKGLSFKISAGSVLTLSPPLVISQPDLDTALSIVIDAIRATE